MPISDQVCDIADRLASAMAKDPNGRWTGASADADPLTELLRGLVTAGVELTPYSPTHTPEPLDLPAATAGPAYMPDGTYQRERVRREIAARRGQGPFRDALRERYGDNCLISKCQVIEAVEAAHIVPYRGPRDNNIENGLLLRCDLHTLFDLDMVGIDPVTLAVRLHPRLAASDDYRALAGQPLACQPDRRPSHAALEARFGSFNRRRASG